MVHAVDDATLSRYSSMTYSKTAPAMVKGIVQGESTINVSVSSLKPNTPVSVTVNGVTHTVSASELAKVNPALQVTKPMPVTQFGVARHIGNAGGHDKGHSSTGNTGNGGSNAQGTHSAEAHGFGNGGPAAAGGGRQGGGFHY